MKRTSAFVVVGLVIALLVFSMSVYTIDQRRAAIKFQLGEIVGLQKDAGLYFKVPLIQNVRYFDRRNLTLDSTEPERVTTGTQLYQEHPEWLLGYGKGGLSLAIP